MCSRKGSPEAITSRIEAALERSIDRAISPATPPRLAMALRYAVFPGGGRIRPRLSLLVAAACGDREPALADVVAAGVELMHCASLAHDDLPCFDDADVRRGRPAIHRAFGEPTAVLVGDALIVHALETVAVGVATSSEPARAVALVPLLSTAAGAAQGLVAGQAWELEPRVALGDYHRAKTASLFEAATAGGALAAGDRDPRWRDLGLRLGEAYQIADDIADSSGAAALLGKPVGQDAARARPNAVLEHGLDGARARLRLGVHDALDCLPPSAHAEPLRRWLESTIGEALLRVAAA